MISYLIIYNEDEQDLLFKMIYSREWSKYLLGVVGTLTKIIHNADYK
jgi:hypothetical protein